MSVRCLSQYRQLALRAHEQSMKSYAEVTELNYFWPCKRFGKVRYILLVEVLNEFAEIAETFRYDVKYYSKNQ